METKLSQMTTSKLAEGCPHYEGGKCPEDCRECSCGRCDKNGICTDTNKPCDLHCLQD